MPKPRRAHSLAVLTPIPRLPPVITTIFMDVFLSALLFLRYVAWQVNADTILPKTCLFLLSFVRCHPIEEDGIMEEQLAELRRLASSAENRRTETGIPRIAMVQGAIPENQLSAVYYPMVNLILTGSKTMTVGDRTFRYDPATYFVMSVNLPAVGSIHPSRSGVPYLAVSLTLEPTSLANLLADLPKPAGGGLYGSGF